MLLVFSGCRINACTSSRRTSRSETESGAAHSISSTRLGPHALRTTAVSLSFRLSFATPLEVPRYAQTKVTLAEPTLVDTVFGVVPSRTRNSELSEIRQQ